MTHVEEPHNPFSDLKIFFQIFMMHCLVIRVCDKHNPCSHLNGADKQLTNDYICKENKEVLEDIAQARCWKLVALIFES